MGSDPGPGTATSTRWPGRRTGPLTDGLFVQASTKDLPDVAELSGREGSGLVLTGPDALDGALAALKHYKIARPVLVDRRRYATDKRVRGTEPFCQRWLRKQRQLGTAAVLTDSGYIGQGDLAALTAVLGQTARYIDREGTPAGGVWAVLPLHRRWLREDRSLLIAQIKAYGVPVALVLEHEADPLGTRVAVEGLVEVLDGPVPTALLSTDVSALGALAYGAVWTAVGMRSSLRHLYPVTPFKRHGSPSALLDPVLTITSIAKILRVYADASDELIWRCPCPVCEGRELAWLGTIPPGMVAAEAGRHTLAALLERREELAWLSPGERRRIWWHFRCSDALWLYDALGLVDRYQWQKPGFLKSWLALHP